MASPSVAEAMKSPNVATFGDVPQLKVDSTGISFDNAGEIAAEAEGREPIAIVGIGLRLPGGVESTDGFWDLLMKKTSTKKEVPSSRYDINGFHDGFTSPGTVKSRYGHFLDCDVDRVDASFFSMSKAEVEKVDPQHKLLLEVIWECMESGGQKNWRGRNIGCYVGVFGEDWLDLAAKDPQHVGRHRLLGYADFASSNRVSYEFDLKGPSMTIRTACSSSLIGLHEAIHAIYTGECESALVAGTALQLTPTMTLYLTEQGVMSPTGSCKTFSSDADGYARGEAVNAIFVKKLSDALRDGDPIRAVVRGTSVGFDGKTNGMANPNPESHEALMRRAYDVAKIKDFSQTAFVECHGTGTAVGDPLETNAIGKVFSDKGQGLYITSVKPNVGHSEGAAGLTSLIKAVLALEHETIPPNINFSSPNPKIKWDKYALKVPTEATAWPEGRVGRVSVNCFGIGGANAHAVIDSAKPYIAEKASRVTEAAATQDASHQLLVFSAHHNDSLQEAAAKIQSYGQAHPDLLPDLSYTLAARREAMACRAFAVTDGKWPLEVSPVVKPKAAPVVNMVFTGQGAQWPAMASDLMKNYPIFQDAIKEMDKALQKLPHAPSWTIEEEIQKPAETSGIQQPEFSQPLCTALQVGLVNLLRSWNVHPAAVVGHSSGEMGAAYAAGALTLDMAIAIAYYRGYITQNQGRVGAMAAIGLGRPEATPYIEDGVVIACENSPKNVTISGDVEKLDQVIAKIKADKPDCFARKLKVERAYHSHHMQEIGQAYQDLLEGIVKDKSPSVPFFSSVTAKKIKRKGQLGASYWKDNLQSPVLFSPAVQLMLHSATKEAVFLEVGPHSAMAGPLRDIIKSVEMETAPPYIASIIRNESGTKSLLKCLGRLYQEAVPVDITATTLSRTTLTDLPNYSWKHDTSYWNESRVSREWRLRKHRIHELLGLRLLESDDLEPTWRNMLRLDDVPWARDHKIQDDIVLPGAAYITMAVEAVRQISGGEINGASLRQVEIKSALVLREGQSTEVVTHLRPVRLTNSLDSSWYEFSVASHNGSIWAKHCTGQVKAGKDGALSVEDVADQARQVSTAGWYKTMKKTGLNYGPEFQGLSNITAGPGKNTAAATIADVGREVKSAYQLHPTIIDFSLQLFTVALTEGIPRKFDKLSIPTYIDQIFVGPGSGDMRVGVSAVANSIGAIRGSASIVTDNDVALSLSGVHFTPIEDGENSANADGVPAAHLHWKPDVDFVAASDLVRPVGGVRDTTLKLERLSLLCLLEVLRRTANIETSEEHLLKFRRWLATQTVTAADGASLEGLSREAIQTLLDAAVKDVQESSASDVGRLLIRLIDNCEAIFRGEVDGEQVLTQDGGLDSIHRFMNSRFDFTPFLELLAHSKPMMRILEIGAGAPGMTTEILNSLVGADGEPTYAKYVYTDSSEESIAAAEERFSDRKNMEFKVFDITREAEGQGIDRESFDLVLAFNALHPTGQVQDAVRSAKQFVRPGGRVIFQELSSVCKAYNLIKGFLPHWWANTETLPASQTLTAPSRWDTELREAGFTGTDAFVKDDDEPYQISRNIVSQMPLTFKAKGQVIILGDASSVAGQKLQSVLANKGFAATFGSLDDAPPTNGNVVSLLDVTDPFWHEVSEENLSKMQNYLGKVSSNCGFFWITGLSQVGCKDPRYAATIGVARTIRSELSLDFATLETDLAEFDANTVASVFDKFASRDKTADLDPDWEYAIAEGTVLLPRYQWIDLSSQTADDATSGGVRKLEIARMGQLKTLQWASDEAAVLEAGEVEIEPRAVGMNFKDVLVAMGIVAGYKPGLGIECSGIVRRVGSGVTDLAPGDRVMTFGHGCFTTSLVCPADLVVRIPEGLSFSDAATVPCVYATAVHALINLGGLMEGQSVLIHSACGGVGIAALNVCKMLGAEIYATVGNETKVKYLMDNFNLPRERIFNSRDSSFYGDLMAATDGHGADLVLNSLSGELLHASWRCVAKFGKMLEIGKRDFIGRAQLGMDVFEANRAFCGIDMSQMAVERPKICKRILQQCVDYLRNGGIKPIKPIESFSATSAIDAFRYMSKGQHIGKIVVTMPDDHSQLELAPKAQDAKFKADRSYLLIGGLGGLGKAVSTWMVENGARNLIYLSRSGGEAEKEQTFVRELESQDCNVQTFKGSVTNIDDVKHVVANAAKPIAGVLHMPMVLRDKQILQLSHEDWEAAAKPKVEGAMNLHLALDNSTLDFLILFSSISYVVGQVGQANYAAANAYLAAFAQYRHSLGLPASVLNVGVMGDVGYVVENQAVLDQFKAMSFHILREVDLLEGLTSSMSTQSSGPPAAGTYANTAELAIGLKSTKPLSDSSNRAAWRRDARMAAAHLKDPVDGQSSGGAGNEDLGQFLSSVASDPSMLDTPANLDYLTRQIGETIYSLMSKAVDELDVNVTLSALGLDSLVTIEVLNWWRHTLGLSSSVLEIMSAGTISALGQMAAKSLKETNGAAPVAAK